MRSTTLISRRTTLKGLGVALALPLLETMGWADPPRGVKYKAPIRLAFINTPYGVQAPSFWPQDASAFTPSGALPATLEPLRPVLGDCLLLDGISNKACRHIFPSPSHGMEISGWLTGVQAKGPAPKADAANAISADQWAARVIGQYTVLPSLEMNCTFATISTSDKPEDGYPDIYKHALSWRSATQPNLPEFNPRSVLNRLFSSRRSSIAKGGGPAIDTGRFAGAASAGAGADATIDQSMLDVVIESTNDLKARVSEDDRRKLDQYLDCVRSLEKRIAAIERQQAAAAQAKAAPAGKGAQGERFSDPIEVKVPEHDYGNAARNGGTIPFSEIMTVMSDLMILAFQADITRVVTLMTSSGYGRNYPELGFSNGHHELSHNNHTDKEMIAKILKIEHLHMQQFARIIQRMKGLEEGSSSLLDNAMVLWGSGMGDGAFHIHDRLPTILAGRGGGTVHGGRLLKVGATQADLLMSILARSGVKPEPVIGDSTKLIEL
jgi:hypothetical protein